MIDYHYSMINKGFLSQTELMKNIIMLLIEESIAIVLTNEWSLPNQQLTHSIILIVKVISLKWKSFKINDTSILIQIMIVLNKINFQFYELDFFKEILEVTILFLTYVNPNNIFKIVNFC